MWIICLPPAVDNGHTEVVKLLVRKGAQVNRIHTASWWTCLHQAVYKVIHQIHRELISCHTLFRVFDEEFSSVLRVTATSFVFLLTFATWRRTMTTRFRRCSWQHSTDRRSPWSSLLMLVSINACGLFISDCRCAQADVVFSSLTGTELTEIISRQQLNKEHLFPIIYFFY